MKVSSIKSLKKHVEKMSAFGLSIMLMKRKELRHCFHYVYENKVVIKNQRTA